MELHEFGTCVQSGGKPEFTGRVGLQAVALVQAVSESSLPGRAVTLAEVESSAVDAYQQEIDEHYRLV